MPVASDQDGGLPRRGCCAGTLIYDLDWDVDAWKLYGHCTPERTIPNPPPAHGS
ncbi:hypothetical protein GCM10010171_63070 [Actinokineospora fastidiosa]|uniref:Uncharacterized protein n=1 Tax=Actinokineospora fastidiosa TaxID=1816 RepID=A0A918GUR2_9PSEU|nr:hypothetical protein GCM10010171_63070 [Actinokineospora fastidiosa]